MHIGVRLRLAEGLLAQTDLSIGDIAERSGVVPHTLLNVVFKSRHGITPRSRIARANRAPGKTPNGD
jgi:transcriptional regulator GlxA family with amidase domain